MKNKLFYIVLLSLLAVCVAITVAHVIYLFTVYPNSSIIYYISKEWW